MSSLNFYQICHSVFISNNNNSQAYSERYFSTLILGGERNGDSNSVTFYIGQSQLVRSAIPITGYTPIGIELVISNISEAHGDQYTIDAHRTTFKMARTE